MPHDQPLPHLWSQICTNNNTQPWLFCDRNSRVNSQEAEVAVLCPQLGGIGRFLTCLRQSSFSVRIGGRRGTAHCRTVNQS